MKQGINAVKRHALKHCAWPSILDTYVPEMTTELV